MKWVVMVIGCVYDNEYIVKVVSYKKHRKITSFLIEDAHKYCSEKTAMKASEAFKGEIKII